MHTTSHLATTSSAQRPAGELAGLIAAGLIAPADRLWRTLAEPRSEPLAEVTADGRLTTDTGAVYPGPREAITSLEAWRYGPIAWQCFTTANGTCLETLRQRAHPDPTGQDREPGALAPLIRAGQLQTGNPLIFEMTAGRGQHGQHVRLLATRTAEVTADGWLRLDDGALYASPSPTAAACCGKLTNGWKAWHLANGRTLHTVRARTGITPPPRPGRSAPAALSQHPHISRGPAPGRFRGPGRTPFTRTREPSGANRGAPTSSPCPAPGVSVLMDGDPRTPDTDRTAAMPRPTATPRPTPALSPPPRPGAPAGRPAPSPAPPRPRGPPTRAAGHPATPGAAGPRTRANRSLTSFPNRKNQHTMTIEPRPTSQLPDPVRPVSPARFESLDPVHGQWPGFPFPPPLMGLPFRVVDQAAAHWLRAVADLVHGGEMNLNTLFALGPVKATCDELGLPAAGMHVVPAAGLNTLGSLHVGTAEQAAGASLSALFAAPSIVQIARLHHAALQLGR